MKNLILVAAVFFLPFLAYAGPVNINTADAEQLSRELVGVGISRAQAIVDYRKEFGRFESPEELIKVKGIGTQVLAANLDNILVDD